MKKPELVPMHEPKTEDQKKPPNQDTKNVSTYSIEESTVLGRIKDIINGDFFHHLPAEAVHESNKQSPAAIVCEVRALVAKIRVEKRDPQEFFAYQDVHFGDPHYAFLEEPYPGLNVNGWRVFMAELDPVKYGVAITRKEFQIRGTISQRSAKT